MPFVSQKQARFLASQHPDLFKKWEAEFHQKIGKLPMRVAKKKKRKKR
mgnify:CR=1 FL=1